MISDYYGEKLSFKISWFGILAGNASIRISETVYKGNKAIKFTGIVKSAQWFSKIYYVEDCVDSIVEAQTLKPLNISVDYKEGKKYRRKNEYIFDYAKKKIFSPECKDTPVDLPDDLMEMFGAFFLLRTYDFSKENHITKIIADGRKLYHVEARKTGRKKISTILGKKDCIEIKPTQIRLDLFGIKQKPDNISVFLTDDAQRIPVLVTGEIRIGSLVAELENAEKIL